MTELPTTPIDHPAGWTADELAGDGRWVLRLDDAERAEIAAAVDAVKAKDLELFSFGRDDFPLPTLGPRLAGVAGELEEGRGCVLLKGMDVSGPLDDVKLAYWGVGVHMGRPVAQNARGDLIGNIRDFGRAYEEKNVRGYTTNAELHYHCDAMDAVSLLCLNPAKSGGQSLIASSTAIFNAILRTRPEALELLGRGFHFDLRGEGVTGDADETTFHKVPVFSWHQGRLSCRYNAKTIVDGQRKAGEPLSDAEEEIVYLVRRLASDPRFQFSMAFEPGDVQVLSNHLVLHSRTSFEDWPDEGRKRHLIRLWFNLDPDVARPLDSKFADRYNTGPRHGVCVTDRHAGWVPEMPQAS